MSNFDKNINRFLKTLIIEQDDQTVSDQTANVTDEQVDYASQIIDQTRQELESLLKQNPDSFYKRANGNVGAMNYAVNKISNAFYMIYETIKNTLEDAKKTLGEQTQDVEQQDSGFSLGQDIKFIVGDVIDDVKNFTWEAAKKAGGAIDGVFEDALDAATDYAVDAVPHWVEKMIGKNNYDFIRNDVKNIDDSFWYKILAVIDITGVLSWTYLDEAKKLYEENLGTEDEDVYTLNLLAAAVAVIPGVSALRVFTLPFKLLFMPAAALLRGGRLSTFARAVSNELKTTLNIGENMGRAANVAGRTGKVSQVAASLGSKVSKAIKPVAKLTAGAAKASTIIASGDIPGTLEKWRKEGEDVMKNIKPAQGTLGQFPKFNQITTQDRGGGNW